MNVYHRKLYALLHDPHKAENGDALCEKVQCLEELNELREWWQQQGWQSKDIGSSSDRVNLEPDSTGTGNQVEVRHPISGQSQSVAEPTTALEDLAIWETVNAIAQGENPAETAKKIFWWLWRFYPEVLAKKQSHALLFPAHKILPDCPVHSYNSTVSALVGAMFPEGWQEGETEHPYLFLFTFSPVQEFIKASRKFLDFWAGSYLLHYLGVKLCWYIAQEYGPDAVITPSLWSQEIIDALIVEKYPEMKAAFASLQDELDPVSRFQNKESTSLSTAGFPNVLTALVPGKAAAEALGEKLANELKREWTLIGKKIRENIKEQVIRYLKDGEKRQKLWEEMAKELSPGTDPTPYQRDLEKWQQPGCWEWNKLWDAQLDNTWETYWTAVSLGNPDEKLVICKDSEGKFDHLWQQAQEAIAPSRSHQPTPTEAEKTAYNTLNVGTWWGNVQSRLGQLIQSVKNTRNWQIPTAPGERSTLSGQFSAVHPYLHYTEQFREGGGLPSGSMRLFWRVMSEVYPGLFNGSEKLNAIELTKRMAWGYGGVAESLGMSEQTADVIEPEFDREDASALGTEEVIDTGEIDYEKLIRFPNLSSIAAARFLHNHPQQVHQYWLTLARLVRDDLPKYKQKFGARTRGRPSQVPKTDAKINPHGQNGWDYNGVMFSSKWLADDMNVQGTEDTATLRMLVDQAHRDSGFGDGSPADWWAIVLADGDGMGKYVSGSKLKEYKDYIVLDQVDEPSRNVQEFAELLKTRKRMGPATHVGLNRALLDFSNRLVPYITEKRFCGKVVYSGGDDVMAVLPLEDLPEFLRSLRAAWCGAPDPGAVHWGGPQPGEEFEGKDSGYWHPQKKLEGLPYRPLFTMGHGATMSMGIVIAYKSVPLPTVLENLWSAEKERAKKLVGTRTSDTDPPIPAKDGLCFRVIYGGGNTLEALMKGHLLESWWKFIQQYQQTDLSPVLYRLAEELPRRACLTEGDRLFSKAAEVVFKRREQVLCEDIQKALGNWLDEWERWAFYAQKAAGKNALGTQPQDLAKLLRFSAFWVDKMMQRSQWVKEDKR